VSLRLEATAPDSLPEIAAFLRGVYRVSSDSPNFDPDLLAWKYYQPGPEWEGSRSFVLRKEEAIVAHGSVWPVRLATPAGTVMAVRVLDWASSAPGMGVALMNQIGKRADVILGVGGSEDTLRVLPAMGFKHRGTARIYARVLRSWRQFRTRTFDGSRAIPRLLRNTQWSRAPLAVAAGWTCTPGLPSAFDDRAADYPESRHSAGFLEFMLRCPGAAMSLFSLSKNGLPQGYFMLSRVGGQCRLAELRIRSDKPEDWIAAYATAARAAARDPQSFELATYATVPLVCQALDANGFRMRGEMPVLVLDRKNLLGDATHLHLGMLDDDSSYLRDATNPYCT
jgi:hypothetical protein